VSLPTRTTETVRRRQVLATSRLRRVRRHPASFPALRRACRARGSRRRYRASGRALRSARKMRLSSPLQRAARWQRDTRGLASSFLFRRGSTASPHVRQDTIPLRASQTCSDP